jgi:hypothetical protein
MAKAGLMDLAELQRDAVIRQNQDAAWINKMPRSSSHFQVAEARARLHFPVRN